MPHLNLDLIPNIVSFLDNPHDLTSFMLVNKQFYHFGRKQFTRQVKFYSLEQRERFFTSLCVFNPDDSAIDLDFKFFASVNSVVDTERVESIDFGLESENASGYATEWEHYFVTPHLTTLSSNPLKNLKSVNLTKCQYFESVFEDLLLTHPNIQSLNLAYSSVRNGCLESVAEYCPQLTSLSLDGIFKLKRIDHELIEEIVIKCKNLKHLSLQNCPNLDDEFIQHLKTLNTTLDVFH